MQKLAPTIIAGLEWKPARQRNVHRIKTAVGRLAARLAVAEGGPAAAALVAGVDRRVVAGRREAGDG